jgi:hypothetical protein
MSETKYAVYIVAVEDTGENDSAIGELGALTIDRLGGNLTETEALDAVMNAETINWEYASLA